MRLALVLLLTVPTCVAPGAPAPPRAEAPLPPDDGPTAAARAAEARLEPVGESGVSGTIRLDETPAGVRVVAVVDGLPGPRHGLHVLRGRTCAADPGVLLGADAGTRGLPGGVPAERLAGRLGSVRVLRGFARYDRIDAALALGGPASAVGRAVVVRDRPDDGGWPVPGRVVACGVLTARPGSASR